MTTTKLFIYGDVHAPYHDKKAVSCMLKAMDHFKPDKVLDMGDFWDCYACSSYSKDPTRLHRLVDEWDIGHALQRDIEDAAGEADLVAMRGNHEDRLHRLLREPKVSMLHGLVSLPQRDRWQVVPYDSFAQIGKVIYAHDMGFCGKYALNQSLQEAAHSIVIGHIHRMGQWVEGTIKGKHLISASFGWLGDAKKADYLHTAKKARHWCHGFGLGHMDPKTGITQFNGIPIIKGKTIMGDYVIEG